MVKRIAVNLITSNSDMVNHTRDGFEIHFYTNDPKIHLGGPNDEIQQPIERLYKNFYGYWLNNLQIAQQMSTGVLYDAIYYSSVFDLHWVTKVFEKYEHLENDYVLMPKISRRYPDVFVPDYSTFLTTPGTGFCIGLLCKALKQWDVRGYIMPSFKHRFETSKISNPLDRLDSYLFYLWCTNQNVRIRK